MHHALDKGGCRVELKRGGLLHCDTHGGPHAAANRARYHRLLNELHHLQHRNGDQPGLLTACGVHLRQRTRKGLRRESELVAQVDHGLRR